MIAFPNAKINLGLNIIEKRLDGFHNLETVFYPINLCDALEIIPTPDSVTVFKSTGLRIPGDSKNNLCIQAYELLKQKFELPNIKIQLHKAIPMGAGLGGGSSDAAQTLMLLNNLFQLKLSQNKLLNYAKKLGADCAFFILNRPVFASERGDVFNEIKLNLKGFQVIIVKPEIHVNTAEAFSELNFKPIPNKLFNAIEGSISDWKELIKNKFEENIFKVYPEIGNLKNALYKNGAVYASMSGSGSAVYGLFKKPIDLTKIFEGVFYFSTII